MAMSKVWRYKLEAPEQTTNAVLRGAYFANEWLSIEDDTITVYGEYAWDGCSPAIPVLDTGVWLGPWDGPLLPDGRPSAWRASLFHDALCQFRHEIPWLSKFIATKVFADELKAAPKWQSSIYPWAVDLLGPQDFPSRR